MTRDGSRRQARRDIPATVSALFAVPIDYGENVKLTLRLGNLNFSI